jgi:hypothetical protein
MMRTACAAFALLSCLAFDPAALAQTAAPPGQSGPSSDQPASPDDAQAAKPADAGADSEDKQKPETIYIFGRATELIGEAKSASEGVVGEADFETRPLLRPGELAEVIPGMIAAQHSGGGKANQYFLRGFNLDHGTDFAGSFDGVPLNLRAHPHMNGYLDLNFMIPEVVQYVNFQKGTGYAENGDFSAAAAANFRSHDRPEENFVELNATDDNEYRLVGAAGYDVGQGTLMAAGEYEWGDGPFDNPADLHKYSAFLKYTRDGVFGAKFHAEGVFYSNDWHATDQMPERAVTSGLIDRFGTLDPDLGGHTQRYIVSAGLDWENTSVLVFGQKYTFGLFNNPTIALDQVHGDEFQQVTDRSQLGVKGNWKHTYDLVFPIDVRVGADLIGDFINRDGLRLTENRIPYQTIRDDSGDVTMGDVWADATVRWTDKFRTTFGGRQDIIYLDFRALQPENSGSHEANMFSPKFNAAYTLTDQLELYGSYGVSFHTNDPRGAVLHTDPNTGDPVTPSPVFVRSHGGEIGARFEPSNKFNFTASLFELDFDSELIFSGDAGTSEPSGATKRYGLEVSTFYRPFDWLTFDASGAWSHARFVDVPKDEAHIPNALEFVGSAGVTFTPGNGWEGSLRARYLGESALIEDNSVRGDPSFIMNAGVSKQIGTWKIGLDILNLTNSKDNEIEYFYTSQLQGEPAPVDDRFIHPLEPRSYRLVLRKNF